MTIAACYVLPEGIVLGADSTISTPVASGGFHYLNHNQKLFELGENSTFGVVTWGLGGIGAESYRSLIARLADHLKVTPPASVADVAQQWTDRVWDIYSRSPDVQAAIVRCKELNAAEARSKDEEDELLRLERGLTLGFCVAGYIPADRIPCAFQIVINPLQDKPTPVQIGMGHYAFWGAPNMIRRLIYGYDEGLAAQIMGSTKWGGTVDELNDLLNKNQLGCGLPPMREAVDFVHTCIYSTIKALKFSSLSQICGGPIEVAVITTDRLFRWVRHKEWDSAIYDGGL